MKKVFFTIGILFLFAGIFSCQEGRYSLGGYSIDVHTPDVEVIDKENLLNVYVATQDNKLPGNIRVGSAHPGIGVLQGIPSQASNLLIYDVFVPDSIPDRIWTNMTIRLPNEPIKVLRGQDLEKQFDLEWRNGRTLIISPNTTIPIPVKGVDNLAEAIRIKGVVARIVIDTTPDNLIFPLFKLQKEEASVWEFPIDILPEKDVAEIHSVELRIIVPKESGEYLFSKPGNVFPNPVIREPMVKLYPEYGFNIEILNVVYDWDKKILAPSQKPSSLPITFKENGEIRLIFKGSEINVFPSLAMSREKTAKTTWGRIRKE